MNKIETAIATTTFLLTSTLLTISSAASATLRCTFDNASFDDNTPITGYADVKDGQDGGLDSWEVKTAASKQFPNTTGLYTNAKPSNYLVTAGHYTLYDKSHGGDEHYFAFGSLRGPLKPGRYVVTGDEAFCAAREIRNCINHSRFQRRRLNGNTQIICNP